MKALRGMRIGIIGCGKMGEALLKGLTAHGVPARSVIASDAAPVAHERLAKRYRIRTTEQNSEVVAKSQVVILAVKPQQFPEVIKQVAPHLTRRHLVISIAAGVTLRWLEKRCPGVAIVRVMPNLPATVGQGFTAMTLGRRAHPKDRAIVTGLFGSVGEVVELPERHFDAVTAVSGSGPAYVFFLVKMWEQAARLLGLPPAVAAKAIAKTLSGSVALLEQAGEPAAQMIEKVASKGGTTEAALQVLARCRTEASFIEALRAAARRSKELSWS